jgi:pyruvate-ferredoxin/flavodoxin oxidoreductase
LGVRYGYGGLDHVLASGRNVNVLLWIPKCIPIPVVRPSKSTPRAGWQIRRPGKGLPKKDLGMIAMAYGYVYVARVAFGANDAQTLKASWKPMPTTAIPDHRLQPLHQPWY